MAIIKIALNCCGDCRSWYKQKVCGFIDSSFYGKIVPRGNHCELWNPWKTMRDKELEEKEKLKKYKRECL